VFKIVIIVILSENHQMIFLIYLEIYQVRS